MIRARHNFLVYGFFKLFTKLAMKNAFHQVKIDNNITAGCNSILLIANHLGWWDGFWALFLSTKIFKKNYHFMMLESELKKRWLFQFTGGFSIAHRAKSMVESLNYTAQLLKNPANLVLMFPQAKMHSIYNHNFKFEKGIERVLLAPNEYTKLIFLVSMLEYFDHPKPDLYLYLQEYTAADKSTKAIETAYNQFITNKFNEHAKLLL